MDADQFWKVIENARSQVSIRLTVRWSPPRLPTCYPHIHASRTLLPSRPLSDLMADSYRNLLWAAAYLINSGCSDDGLEYFRCWLIVQGRTLFERSVANPDTLADLPVIQAAAAAGAVGIECEAVRSIALEAYRAATSEQLPEDAFTIGHPELDADWDDFDDRAEMRRRLPRLTALNLLGRRWLNSGPWRTMRPCAAGRPQGHLPSC
jgi:hypothetical protein